jgi:N-acyl-D-aspartate/D-glutamate deacylase
MFKASGCSAWLLWCMLLVSDGCGPQDKDFDVLIRGGAVIDGTGSPAIIADVGIRGDVITAVGDLKSERARKIINASGLSVSPGFIDVHTHCDRGLGKPHTTENINYVTQGVTTVITGNCGSGSFDIAGMKAAWDKTGIGSNAVMMTGFGTIRTAVMGLEIRDATPDELEQMKSILRNAMKQGAWGLSTALPYIPDRYAKTDEVIALAKIVAELGGVYCSHIRDEGACLIEAIQEHIKIGKGSGARVNISHLKASGKDNWGLMGEAVRVINKARSEGIFVTADMYPYDRASIVPFMMSFNVPDDMEPFTALNESVDYYYVLERLGVTVDDLVRMGKDPPIGRVELAEKYAAELENALQDQDKREKIKRLTLEGAPDKLNWVTMFGWDNFVIVHAKKNPELIGRILSDIAHEQNKDPFDVAVELFLEEKSDLTVSVCIMSEDDIKLALQQDWLMISSDGASARYKVGRVHPRYYGSAVRVLGRYVREEKTLALPDAVRKMTSFPAQLFGIRDRGLLRKGYKADIVVFDPDTVKDNATYQEPHQLSSGIIHVIINGKISVEAGEYNHALNGRVLLFKSEG